MGQEASVPLDEATFEEQARAPPSATGINNGSSHTSPQRTSSRPAAAAARVMHAFRHHKDGRSSNNSQHSKNSDYSYDEAVRVAAANGMFYSNSRDSSSHHSNNNNNNNNNDDIRLTPVPSQQSDHSNMFAINQSHSNSSRQTAASGSSAQTKSSISASTASTSQQSTQSFASSQQSPTKLPAAGPQVGVMYEKTPSKRGFLSGRGNGRGAALVNSVRNMTLSGRKKDAVDWEKNWDDDESDDDESDENDEEDEIDFAYMQQHQQQGGENYQQDGASVQSSAAAASSHQSVVVGSPPRQPQEFVQTVSSLSHASTAASVQQQPYASPPQAPQAYVMGQKTMSTVSTQSTTQSVKSQQQHQRMPEPPDLLSGSSNDDELEWDTGAAASTDGALKPNAHMFPMLRVLGKGSFGKVVLVQKESGKESGQLFAMKILRKSHLVRKRQIERTRTERKVLSVVNHPFIMKLHYAFQTDDKLYLVLDYCPGGELFFHLSRFRRFPERVARFFAAELLLAIGHLHKRGIIYRDLKPENVLLDADGHIKLGDFGLAKAGVSHPYQGAISMCGTPEYMAPEVLAQQGHGFGVDYWGLGMLVYEMMTGLPPWYTTDRAKLFRRLKSAPLDIPSYFSDAAADISSQLLERNPRRRLGVMGIRPAMEHEFFRVINWKHLYARRTEPPVKPCEAWKATAKIKEEVMSSQNGGSALLQNNGALNNNELDLATNNFDATFLRMPVESEDIHHEDANDSSQGAEEELQPDTFIGFSFDSKDREAADEAYQASRRSAKVNAQVPPTFPNNNNNR